jgi:hypothetical protein
MTIKVLGIFTGLLGLAMIVCMVMTWREMQSARFALVIAGIVFLVLPRRRKFLSWTNSRRGRIIASLRRQEKNCAREYSRKENIHRSA